MAASLEQQAKIIVKELGNAVVTSVDTINNSLAANIVPRTPVRTGHARRNWQYNLGSPNGQELPGVDFAGESTITNMRSRIRATKNRNPFVPTFIENNVPYILRLNEGYSRQAPPMFVQAAIAIAVRSAQ